MAKSKHVRKEDSKRRKKRKRRKREKGKKRKQNLKNNKWIQKKTKKNVDKRK